MNRGFHGRAGLLGLGFGGSAMGMGVSPFLIPPALYQLSPSPSTTVAQHSDAVSSVQKHSEASAVVEYDP
jgi:hypothetical protein